METKKYYLAVDIGASSGRHILGSVTDGKIEMEEIHRFENGMRIVDGHKCWDVERITIPKNFIGILCEIYEKYEGEVGGDCHQQYRCD